MTDLYRNRPEQPAAFSPVFSGNEDIRNLEEVAMNAWPAFQIFFMDGWVLRFADGYTRRANSVHPLYPSTRNVKEKMEACEQIYRGKGLRPVFKITPASLPASLDRVLAGAGYSREGRTGVLLLSLGPAGPKRQSGVELVTGISPEWHSAFCVMSKIPQEHQATVFKMMSLQLCATCLAVIRNDGKVIGCGLGILQGLFLGITDVVVDPRMRQRGYGRDIVQSLLEWGRTQGARTAWLQVEMENAPALALYSGMGFREAYQYWYRVKP